MQALILKKENIKLREKLEGMEGVKKELSKLKNNDSRNVAMLELEWMRQT